MALPRTVLGVVLGLLTFGAGCELLLRALPVSTATMSGYTIDPLILSYPPHHDWTASTGWDLRNAQRMRSNNLGFVSEHDFVPDPAAVALIGDSFVEASMLAPADRPGPQLERLLGGKRPVYAFGGPGSSMLDYAERIRYAYVQLGVRDFVVLMESGDVRQSLCGSGHVHGRCLDRETLAPRSQTLPPPSPLKQVVRHSALAQYLGSQLKIEPGRLLHRVFDDRTPQAPAEPGKAGPPVAVAGAEVLDSQAQRLVGAVAAEFLARVAEAAPQARVVVVSDGPRLGAPQPARGVTLERRRFLELLAAGGVTVVDADGAFAAHAAGSRLSLAVGPHDSHPNAMAVRLLMQAVVQRWAFEPAGRAN